jgi:predicted transcriptional regulator
MVLNSQKEGLVELETDEIEHKSSKGDSNKKLHAQHPIELEYWFILPALRRAVATTLKESGLKQKDVAKILGITEAGVSQYLKGSRGVLKTKSDELILFPEWIKVEVSNSCKAILQDPSDHNNFLKEINRLLLIIRERPSEFLCSLHNEYGIIDSDCNVCM